MLPAALWFVTAFAAAAPGLLLLTNADSPLPAIAGAALLVAGVVAFLLGAALPRVSSRPLLLAGAAVRAALRGRAARP